MSQMLTATLSNLAPRLKLNFTKPVIDNLVFKMHYKATGILLITCVVLVCAKEYFGEQIKCIADKAVPEKVIESYCFFMGTFTIVRYFDESMLQRGIIPHPGVGTVSDNDEIIHYKYYQWVPFVLFIQAVCFYMPHYVWKKKEGGRIRALVEDLRHAKLALDDVGLKYGKKELPSKKTVENRIELIRKDFILRLRINKTWSAWLIAMEVTNLVHIIFEIWITNVFLNKAFVSLGPKIFSFKDWNKLIKPLEFVFPQVTKCTFHAYGPSGTVQQHDALCVLALNTVYEKIYAILWFWFLFVFIASVIVVIWRIISFFVYHRSVKFNEVVFRKMKSTTCSNSNIISVTKGCTYWDWLFLYYIGKNMNGFVFQELYNRLAEELENIDMPRYEHFKNKPGFETSYLKKLMFEDETQ